MDEEDLNASKRRKIEDTVLQILKASDLDTVTELSVRAAAKEQLGLVLSDPSLRRRVQQLVDSFVLSEASSALDAPLPRTNGDLNCINDTENGDYNGKIICKLSESRMVAIHDMCGTTMVAIRDFGFRDGRHMRPIKGENSGLSLTPTQWSSFRNNFPSIQAAIVNMESRLRPEVIAKQSEADMTKASSVEKIQKESDNSNSTSITRHPVKTAQVESEVETTNQTADSNSNPQAQIPTERNKTEADSESAPPFTNQASPHNTHTADISSSVHSRQLVPIQPIRLDERNYYSWRQQMEFSLNQLNIAYVLSEPCPTIPSNPDTSSDQSAKIKASIEKWTKDDYTCYLNILNSLCDNLFKIYSPKNCSARDLWGELKLAYNEDFGTKRSLINKYIQFQMAEGVSIIEQAQELGKIADSIIASGTWVDEKFHVGVVVSKLPPSWKEVRIRLLREEFLSHNMLMHRLQVEEEYRMRKVDPKKGRVEPKLFDAGYGARNKVSKKVCYSCGKEGHISTNCPQKKSNEKESRGPSPRRGSMK